jgi:fucose permease
MQRIHLWTGICFAAFIVTGICVNLLGATIPNLTERYDMALSDGGIFIALQAFGSTTGVLIFGRLLDRADARYVLCGGSLLFGVGVLLLGFAPVLPLALIGTLLLGLGFGAMLGGPNYVVATLYNERAASALNALNVFYSLGAILGPQFVAIALNQGSYSHAYVAGSILMFALTLPFLSIQINPRKVDGEKPKRVNVSLYTLLPFIVLFFAYIGTEVGFGSWIFTQLSTVALADVETAALATSLFWSGQMLGRIAGSIILRRVEDVQLLPLTIALIGLGVSALLIVQSNASLSIIAAFVVGVGCGPVFPTTLGIVRKAYPTVYGTASGILIGLGNIGAIVLPWVQGQVGGGTSGGMQLILVLSVVMLATAVAIQRMVKMEPAI